MFLHTTPVTAWFVSCDRQVNHVAESDQPSSAAWPNDNGRDDLIMWWSCGLSFADSDMTFVIPAVKQPIVLKKL